MVFNSLQFLWFFLIVFALYSRLGHRPQNRLLLAASYLFYGAWDWRFLSLLAGSTALDYYCARLIHGASDPSRRRRLLWVSMSANLLILGVFKYYGFFAASLGALLAPLGLSPGLPLLSIVLPVGISFYTFQSMSYVIDVYRRELEPARSLAEFALFVSFFPQLVAGPIERAGHLLTQIQKPRRLGWDGVMQGFFWFSWGLFEKIVVADNLSRIVDPVFAEPGPYNGPRVLAAVYAFAFQIYCDFDGYSNMARGLAAMMGFELMANFDRPYFAWNPREFWARWHISLSRWLRDYLYIPLGGNRGGESATCRNLLLTMLLGGLWHGAAWTFVLWGGYHGLLLVAHRLTGPSLGALGRKLGLERLDPSGLARRALKAALFFHLVCVGWIFFRAASLEQAFAMLRALAGSFALERGSDFSRFALRLVLFASPVIGFGLLQSWRKDALAAYRLAAPARALIYAAGLFYLALYGLTGGKEFIYFQF